MNDAILQPEVLDAESDAAFHDGRNVFRRAKHIHDIGQFGEAFQVRKSFFAQHLYNHGAHRHDAVAETLQTLCYAKTGPCRIRRQTHYCDTVHLMQQFADLIGTWVGELHGEARRHRATIIYHRYIN